MMTDYKIWYVKRDDNDKITECGVRFYEGDITTEDEYDLKTKTVTPVTRYRRSRLLTAQDLPWLFMVHDSTGHDVALFATPELGDISTDDELSTFLDAKLSLDNTRTPINTQNQSLNHN